MSGTHTIPGHGGVQLFVRDTGPKDAPAIVLLHGWSQSSLSWSKQTASDLAITYRLITPDLRGHGSSDKPSEANLYQSSEIWAEDINAILTALSLDTPILAGWSMGSWLVGDYLRHFGDSCLGGIGLIGGAVTTGKCAPEGTMEKRRPDVQATGSYHKDPALQIPAIIDFLKACTAAPLSKRDLALMTGFNMACPPNIRKACRTRSEDYRDTYAKLTKPALLIQGAAERVMTEPFFEQAKATIPHATAHLYKGIGHAPFWEDAPRFNNDLAAFMASIFPKYLPPEASAPATQDTVAP